MIPACTMTQDTPADRECSAMDPEATIAEIRRAYIAAFNTGRIDEVVNLHTEDVISMPPG
jgi:ketosteroid isomerase-like protein